MKRLFALLILAVVFSAAVQSCGSKKDEAKEEKAEEAYDDYQAPEDKTSTADLIAQGQVLVDGSDCKTCHHPTNKILGPSHSAVAEKYEFTKANVSLLADKIINGGSGTWGDVAMTPHSDLSRGEAEKMAMYVLSLDGEQYKE